MIPLNTESKRRQPLKVVLAVMTMEPHGGVADQITMQGLELPAYGVTPIVLIRNPLAPQHGYVPLLRDANVDVRAVQYTHYYVVRKMCRFLCWVLLPVAVMDAVLRHKTLYASQDTVWSLLRRLGYAGLDLIFWLQLIQLCLLQGVQLVHFRKPDSWPWIPRVRWLGSATIYSEETIPWQHTIEYYLGLRSVSSSIGAVTALSQASARALETYLPTKRPIRVIPAMVSRINSSLVHKSNQQDNFFVGSLARLDPEKDIETLLLAARSAIEQEPRIKILIFGDGSLRSNLERLSHNLGLNDHVVFRGAFPKVDLPKIMAEIDVIALSSHYEGFGIVLVEGMAFGKPVIATEVGGVTDIIEHNVTGVLVPPHNPEAFAAAIVELSRNQQLYKRLACAASNTHLSRFTPEQVVPQYISLYQELVQ